jgi:signal transduction histidine kinase
LTARWVIRLVRDRERQMHERNRELDAFAGRVAHDLRGPLTKIYLASSMLDHRKIMPEASAPLRRGVDQMEGIIQDLLTLSRVSALTMTESCQMADVAATLEEDFKSKVESLGGILRIQVAPASVRCNPGLLRQALSNLAENAVKYRRPEVPLVLEVRGRSVSHAYGLSVSDNGTGMSPTDVKQAFEPFFRGEHVTGIPGTGLGLSIVKRAIEANGGSVDVHSALGHGTTINIKLPLAASKAA